MLTPGVWVVRLRPSRAGPRWAIASRRGEALALRWSDIDFDENLLRVRGTLARVAGELVVTETKTQRSRRVVPYPLLRSGCCATCAPNQRVERLRAGSMWQSTPYVFTTGSASPVILATRYAP
jgi:integrase